MGNFARDRAYGEQNELLVMEYLTNEHPDCEWIRAVGMQKAYDLICYHCGQMVEIKADRLAPTTGNICFEDNLFIHTNSQRVVYVIAGKGYIFDTKELIKELAKLELAGKGRRLLLGDRNANSALLVRMDDIIGIAKGVEFPYTIKC